MEEEKVVQVELEDETNQIQIADDVIAIIAEIAALEVEGMMSVGQGKTDFVQSIRGKKASKGIRVEVGDGDVFIDIIATIKYGTKIPEVCMEVQQKVKNSIETMTGLSVQSVNVNISGVYFEKDKNREDY
ncbi:MAG: Asp23/Gls24 family envelope stress response protein [Cellulosilyticaceae bacterium]